ncbi:ATP-binding protein [Streptomyces sp. GESEQ-35]|uniref:ATP-binding protein n=1 Tax=Streptomyces sp. GESEQ-35 TaxID=2812657 RepID=UPI001B332470|nr:ATP-binding protein [Streptomyces sp. GESEQ-35]
MLQLSGFPLPDPGPRYGANPQPPLGAGYLSVEYEPCPIAVREARAEVRRQLEIWGLAERDDVADTAELLVSELATNAVLHSESRFTLTLTAAHGVLRCEVADAGHGQPRVLDAGTSESGRGMFLVDALALRWGCLDDRAGTTVWFELGTCACASGGSSCRMRSSAGCG